ncbi:MAG: outer membrane beta-barrel protein [Bacteroidales bacterium]
MKAIHGFIVLIMLAANLQAQITDSTAGFTLGINYGGPLPTEMDTADYGYGLPGGVAGLEYRFYFSEKLSLNPSVLYNFRQFAYGTTQKEDTVVEVDLQGNGNTSSVPTYYTADVEGHARLHQFDLRLPVNWKPLDFASVHAGLYGSWVFAGKDEATATVQIGEGSIIDDVVETSDAFEYLNPFEVGVILGGSFYLNPNLRLSFEGTRALSPYYRAGYYAGLNDGRDTKFYQTYGIFRISYYY